MHVLAQLGAQIDDRIDHQLPGTMIRYIAAAAGPDDRNIFGRKHVGFVAAATESVDMAMLDEKEDIGRGLLLLARNDLFLQGQCGEIIR